MQKGERADWKTVDRGCRLGFICSPRAKRSRPPGQHPLLEGLRGKPSEY